MDKKQKLVYLELQKEEIDNENATLENGLYSGDDKQIDFTLQTVGKYYNTSIYVYFEFNNYVLIVLKKFNVATRTETNIRMETTKKDLKSFEVRKDGIKINGLKVDY